MSKPTDLDLLRRHEPILRFTDGELFFPMAAGSYVEACELLTGPNLREARVSIPAGELDLERLAAVGDPLPGEAQFLRFVAKPMSAFELRRWQSRPEHQRFSAPGRLARVGLPARLVDAGLVTSLLARGRVPGGTAAAASERYDAISARDPRVVYHGRVVREGRWIVLHYMFFYAMNDWRSTFDGANDHEADLEQCFVVLEALDDGTMEPAWFCAAAHDEKGDDLRRRWDDPRMEILDGHPVVYPGAGSHATYLERGEYIMLLPFPGERNIRGPLDLLRRVWRDTLAQPDPGDLAARTKRALSVPFVDYARGDGKVVGPGGDVAWTPIIVSDEDGWIDRYRGLWGLDTGDRFAGERAPAGPKYTRTGSVRQSWHDPLGFAGLGKVAPAEQAIPTLETRIEELTDRASGGRGRSRGACHLAPGARRGDGGRPGRSRPGPLSDGTGPGAQGRRGASGQPARAGGGARHGDRRRSRPAGRPASRLPRRPAAPSPPRVGARTAVRRAPSGVRRGVGRSERRAAHRRPGDHRLVPHPAAAAWPSSCSSARISRSSRSSTATSWSWSSGSRSSWR